MTGGSRATLLAKVISENTDKLESYHQSHGLPLLTFGIEAAVDVVYPPAIEQARQQIIDATSELGDLAKGPRDMQTIAGWDCVNIVATRAFFSNFNVAQHVPVEGDISYDDLSQKTGVIPSVLQQFIRAATTLHVFQETRTGFVSHTAASKLLAQDPIVQAMSDINVVRCLGASANVPESLRQFPAADDPGKSAAMLTWGNGAANFFDYLSKNRAEAATFVKVMDAYHTGPGFALSHSVNDFPWEGLKADSTVVDLGGSSGQLAFEMVKKAPSLEVIVQELPRTAALGVPQSGKKVSFQAHDFFTEQTVKHADAYIYRWCLHNWPDPHVVRILRALIPALKPGAKVVIIDEILPPSGQEGLGMERALHTMDINMRILLNARSRDIDAWKEVFGDADKRFRFDGVKQSDGSRLAVMTLSWQP